MTEDTLAERLHKESTLSERLRVDKYSAHRADVTATNDLLLRTAEVLGQFDVGVFEVLEEQPSSDVHSVDWANGVLARRHAETMHAALQLLESRVKQKTTELEVLLSDKNWGSYAR